jgi:hypothetical protein
VENTGWIKLHRSFLKWEWYNDANTKMLFIHLLLKVNYEDKEWHKVDIPKGSCITSYGNLAKELGLSVQNVRTAITKLKSTREITVKSTNKFIVVTLENWEKYQYGEIKINTQNNNQTNFKLTTTKEIKNIYLYFIKKYREQNCKGFRDKMKFLRDIQTDENYKQLSESEEYELRNLILEE